MRQLSAQRWLCFNLNQKDSSQVVSTSASGQTEKFGRPPGMSVPPPGADLVRLFAQVRLVPILLQKSKVEQP
jgi:hypothetical protein